MHIYFKMRNPEDMTVDDQERYITKYVTDLCHFERCGVQLDEFLEHTAVESKTAGKKFVIGSFSVDEDADFAKIEKTMKAYSLHTNFVIFIEFK